MVNYRAWDKERCYMEYTTQNLIVSFYNEGVDVVDNESLNSACMMMENYDLMQSSEIFDKNNKEFYNKDIVEQISTGKICFIEHKKSCFFINDGKELINLYENYTNYVIIGNTYENEELLDLTRTKKIKLTS